jgi:TolA-binding protein
LEYLPRPEQTKLWRLSRNIDEEKDPVLMEELKKYGDPHSLFQKGMELFDKQQYWEAQRYYYEIFSKFAKSPEANNALYYHAICFFRQGDWENTIADFNNLIDMYPQSQWVAGAYYHIGLSHVSLNNKDKANSSFAYVIKHFPDNTHLVDLSKTQVRMLLH